jgi:hypothetical protein
MSTNGRSSAGRALRDLRPCKKTPRAHRRRGKSWGHWGPGAGIRTRTLNAATPERLIHLGRIVTQFEFLNYVPVPVARRDAAP